MGQILVKILSWLVILIVVFFGCVPSETQSAAANDGGILSLQ
jgi:hypothetical protein